MKPQLFPRTLALAVLAACSCAAQAADWTDTSLSYRHGSNFAEPFVGTDISKNILNLSSASGYKYGKNFFSVDYLMSSSKDPSALNATTGAREIYVVYRHTLDLGKITGANLAFGPVKGVGATGGFDFNTKTDAGYNSKKQMLVLGPTLMMNVPGFMDISVLAMWESNAPSGFGQSGFYTKERYRYKTHPMLTAAWGIPFNIAGIPLSFEGFGNFIAAKGLDEFGGATKPETNIDMQIMYDIGTAFGSPKNTFKIGLEYQYWKNKFGVPTTATNPGATAKTPMIRAEYHF